MIGRRPPRGLDLARTREDDEGAASPADDRGIGATGEKRALGLTSCQREIGPSPCILLPRDRVDAIARRADSAADGLGLARARTAICVDGNAHEDAPPTSVVQRVGRYPELRPRSHELGV